MELTKEELELIRKHRKNNLELSITQVIEKKEKITKDIKNIKFNIKDNNLELRTFDDYYINGEKHSTSGYYHAKLNTEEVTRLRDFLTEFLEFQ